MKLPSVTQLLQHLNLRYETEVTELVDRSLLAPLRSFLAVPGKNFRAQLVELGWQWAHEQRHPHAPPNASAGPQDNHAHGHESKKKLCSLLEMLHAASLIVDDIEDASLERRGQPTLHRQHGLAVALNAGNWLYFWPLMEIQTWDKWGVCPETQTQLAQAFERTLVCAHMGQALDVAIAADTLPQKQVQPATMASFELKTGALMGLALEAGARLHGCTQGFAQTLREVGVQLGTVLQIFDDLGNLLGHPAQAHTKRLEDLRLKRLSWVWACAGAHLEAAAFSDLIAAVHLLPDEGPLWAWVKKHDFLTLCRKTAQEFFNGFIIESRQLLEPFQVPGGLARLHELGERIARSYEP